jgi:hypothetical protein
MHPLYPTFCPLGPRKTLAAGIKWSGVRVKVEYERIKVE